MSFALLVYASAWFKRYYPAAFCVGLLRAQPMGFYSPQSLVADARRHNVLTHNPDPNLSLPHATLEADEGSEGGVAIRLGLAGIRLVGQDVAERIVAERDTGGPYGSIGQLTERVQLERPVVEALATAGVFSDLGPDHRAALWAAGTAAATRAEHLPGLALGHAHLTVVAFPSAPPQGWESPRTFDEPPDWAGQFALAGSGCSAKPNSRHRSRSWTCQTSPAPNAPRCATGGIYPVANSINVAHRWITLLSKVTTRSSLLNIPTQGWISCHIRHFMNNLSRSTSE